VTLHVTCACQDGSLDRLDGLDIEPNMLFVDAGYSSSTLIRPEIERLRGQPADGAIDRPYVLSPDRRSRKNAYQVLLDEEF
jgi:site-specific DNA recombinase